MGSVYRAVDTAAGGAVAVKVLDIAPPGAADRFLREAKVLSRLSHRNIVRYVSQGADGPALWLAMEWLEGRTLAEMLEGGPLPLEAALNVAEQLAAGLAEAHAAGIVHRDVKPSNVVLRAGSADDVRLIDFGIAQLTASTQRLTGTGQFIGTAGYMAPEQIASPNSTDARVDVFALGCVLFESMTGSPAFPGASAVAVMAKILADDPPRPSAVAAHVPSGVDRLIGRMLAKSPEQRPSDMSAILGELRALRSAALTSEQRGVPPAQMTRREQHLVGVVLVTSPDGGGDMKAAIAAAIAHEARVFRLDDRAYLFVIRRAATADEEAARAAECALAVRAAAPSAHIAVATGLAESDAMMVGPAIDRCNTLLARGTAPGRIALDEATAGLLQGRFEIARSQDGAVLVAPTTSSGSLAPRGDRTPLVGRDKEVRYLEAELDELVDEPAPRAVLLVGDAGSGKSRVLDKLLSRAHARDARSLYARARVVGAGSALALARQLVRHASALPDDAATTALKGALRGRLATTYAEAELPRTLDFLVELCEPGAQADVVPELVAARNEPRMLADWLRRTFVEWLRREASRSLLVVALEDLHWADNASLAWIGEVMRASRDLPLLVVATGRPEVHERVPALRDLLQPQELRLGPLGRKASEQLARALLGVHSTPEAVERVVELSAGNPFFLEELARRGAIAADASRSWTLVAVLQSRLGQLDPRVRRVLRAASVFGRTFSEDALRELLGDEGDSPLRADLLSLVKEELLESPGLSAPGSEWTFRHDLLRDAAYATIPEDERARAHGLAAAWLERKGRAEPLAVADHLERAGRASDAAEHLLHAAELAQRGGSLPDALELIARARPHVAPGRRGLLEALAGSVHAMMRDWTAATDASNKALSLVPPGTLEWFRAAAIQTFASLSNADANTIGRVAAALEAIRSTPEPSGPYAFSIMTLVVALGMAGKRDTALQVLERVEGGLEEGQRDPSFTAWGEAARSHANLLLRDDPGRAAQSALRAARIGSELEDRVLDVSAAFFVAQSLLECGDARGAMAAATRALSHAAAVPYIEVWAQQVIARAHLRLGDVDAALLHIDDLSRSSDLVVRHRAAMLGARAAYLQGDRERSLELAHAVLASEVSPFDVAHAADLLAHLALDAGDLEQARRHVDYGKAVAASRGAMPTSRSSLDYVHAAVLEREGHVGEAARAAATAAGRVRRLRSVMPTPETELGWLALAENVALLELAARLHADASPPGEAPASQRGPAPSTTFFDEESTVDVVEFSRPTDPEPT